MGHNKKEIIRKPIVVEEDKNTEAEAPKVTIEESNDVVESVFNEVMEEIVQENDTNKVEEEFQDVTEVVNQMGFDIETSTPQSVVIGIVSGCEKLNVRKKPETGDNVLCVINKDEEVEIEIADSTEEYYKVFTSNGFDGYCMKKFIAIK